MLFLKFAGCIWICFCEYIYLLSFNKDRLYDIEYCLLNERLLDIEMYNFVMNMRKRVEKVLANNLYNILIVCVVISYLSYKFECRCHFLENLNNWAVGIGASVIASIMVRNEIRERSRIFMQLEINNSLVLMLQNVDNLFRQIGRLIGDFDKDVEPHENKYCWTEFYSDTVFYEMLKKCQEELNNKKDDERKEKHLEYITSLFREFEINKEKVMLLCEKEYDGEIISIVNKVSNIFDGFEFDISNDLFQQIIGKFNDKKDRKEFYDNINRLHSIAYEDWEKYCKEGKGHLQFPFLPKLEVERDLDEFVCR